MIEHRDEHRRHAVDRRAAFIVDRAQRGFSLEGDGGHDHRRPVRDGSQIAHHAPEAVVERHRHANPIRRGEPQRLANEESVVQDVVMRQRRAFRRSGRARRVLNVRRIVELQLRLAVPQVSVGATVAVPNEVGPRDSAWCSFGPQINHVPQTGHRPGCDRASRRRGQFWHEPDEHLDVVGLAEVTRGDEHADARLVECVFQLSQPVRRVDVDQNRANFRRGVLRDHPFRGVGTPDPDAITAFHPEREQPSSRAIDFAKELSVACSECSGG